MRIGERYVELVLFRLRLLLSIEAVCLAALFWASITIIDRLGLSPPLSLRISRPNLFFLHQVAGITLLLLQFAIVYGIGELVRRKFKLKSLLFFDTKNEEIKQKIIELMKDDPTISIGDIADVVDLYPGHTEAYINALEKSGQISSEGWWWNRRWFVYDEE